MVTVPLSEVLHELRYWMRIMQEHALFIRMGLPNDRPDLMEEANRFYTVFTNLLQVIETSASEQNIRLLLSEVRSATEALLAFKRRLLNLLIQCQLVGGSNYPLLIDHIAREAQEFLRLLDAFLLSDPERTFMEWALEQEVFWLRIMAEHALFIAHLLDPSELTLVQQANDFAKLFYRLLIQAMDLQSMLQANPASFPTVGRFTEEVIARTTDLRNFKRAAFELLSRCQALSIAPPLIADHLRREADHFLEILNRIRQVPGIQR